jgi:hypothetical protein
MVNAPIWLYAMGETLTVCKGKVRERVECEREVEEASCVWIFGNSARQAGDGDAVVLFVLGQEAEHVVFVLDCG